MNFDTLNIWYWLIPVLAGIICGILGYIIGKGSTAIRNNSVELKNLQAQNSKLLTALDACHKKGAIGNTIEKSLTEKGALATSFEAGSATNSFVFDAAAAKAILGKNIKQNDLKVIEGIGPKIEGMFKEHGIHTWKALSETSVADCQKVLDTGGKRYQIHDPASWPMQAKMCFEGKWRNLIKWQEKHKHGKL